MDVISAVRSWASPTDRRIASTSVDGKWKSFRGTAIRRKAVSVVRFPGWATAPAIIFGHLFAGYSRFRIFTRSFECDLITDIRGGREMVPITLDIRKTLCPLREVVDFYFKSTFDTGAIAMKTRLLVVSTFLALTMAACGQKEDAAAKAKESVQKPGAAAEASKEAAKDSAAAAKDAAKDAAVATKDAAKDAAVAAKDATKDAVAATKDAAVNAAAATKEVAKDAAAATKDAAVATKDAAVNAAAAAKEAGKDAVAKAADATKAAADKAKDAVGK
ncbi:MAG TPA: hypothetical protein PKN13_10520 [Accumulibacter sp.]|nr:hypothetical protein [Accumulibacter sp.]HMW18327.1 hypothetical protein [Accumulibacter sp.]HMX22972.1 hypothetical protein [Accumulibacter sp.]HMY06088.1 hypothetical protein [Accumulibacter sp.]HNC18373.1 hypothetical protein [Accumulibacter sp.]